MSAEVHVYSSLPSLRCWMHYSQVRARLESFAEWKFFLNNVATATFFSSFTLRKSNLTNKRQQQQQIYSLVAWQRVSFFAIFSSSLIHDRRHWWWWREIPPCDIVVVVFGVSRFAVISSWIQIETFLMSVISTDVSEFNWRWTLSRENLSRKDTKGREDRKMEAEEFLLNQRRKSFACLL